VTPAELQQAKALLLRQIPLGESSEDSVGGLLLARAQIGLPLMSHRAPLNNIFRLPRIKYGQHSQNGSSDGFVQIIRGRHRSKLFFSVPLADVRARCISVSKR